MKKKRKYIAERPFFADLLYVLGILVVALLLLALWRGVQDCRHAERVHRLVEERTGGLDPAIVPQDSIPTIIPPCEGDSAALPEEVLLEQWFPPVGDQGPYGTCVAFSVGYNLHKALLAQRMGLGAQQLQEAAFQTSAADLWRSIPPAEKGSNCQGTGFGSAFAVMTTRGACSVAEAPYDAAFEPCQSDGIGDGVHLFSSYAQLQNAPGSEMPTAEGLKCLLADSVPLVVGIRCGESFMQWDSPRVLRTETFRYTGMHALHAIALVGYSDRLHAFRLRNSWGSEWADEGSI